MFDFQVETTKHSTIFQSNTLFDVLIIGGGPAGLNAALYAKRKGILVGVITKEIGGQLHNTSEVDNYLGIMNVHGKDISDQFLKHVNALDIDILKDVSVTSLEKRDDDFYLSLSNGQVLTSKTVIMTSGGAPRQLSIPGETQFQNKGVSYCTTCDAPFFKDKHVIVAGGGNSAAEAVLDLVPWASKITVIHRSKWRADQVLLDKHQTISNLTVHLETQILEVLGQTNMTGVKVLDKTTNEIRIIEADGLFIEIGTVPNVSILREKVMQNESGEIIIDAHNMTSCPGLFAAGDVTNIPYKQIIIAAAEGAKAALSANQYINKNYKEKTHV
jgi:NADH-dependent peroxiredoxin subunit F